MTPALFSIVMLLRMGAGLLVWASAFVMLYAGHALACQWFGPVSEVNLWNPVTGVLAALALAHMAALMALGVLWWRSPPRAAAHEPARTQRFRHRTEGLLLVVSAASLCWLALPLVLTPPCIA